MNLTSESKSQDKAEIEEYLSKFGKLSVCKPIKDRQGNKLAKESYFLSLNYNSSLEDSKFVKFAKDNNVIIQLNIYGDY